MNEGSTDWSKFLKAFGILVVIVVVIASCNYFGDGGIKGSKVRSYLPSETATLSDGTQITITDVREEWGFLADQTVFTVIFKAADAGHHPSSTSNTITPSRDETVYADDSISIGSVKGLSEPMAAHTERELRIGFNVEIHELVNAQLNLDSAIFAGDFTRIISASTDGN